MLRPQFSQETIITYAMLALSCKLSQAPDLLHSLQVLRMTQYA